MSETQLTRFEKKFDRFVEYVQSEVSELSKVRADVVAIRAELATLREEIRNQYEAVTDRLKRLEQAYTGMNFEIVRLGKELATVRHAIEDIRGLMLRLETQAIESHVRVSQFRDDMQQRFKVVNERLAAMERLLAA